MNKQTKSKKQSNTIIIIIIIIIGLMLSRLETVVSRSQAGLHTCIEVVF